MNNVVEGRREAVRPRVVIIGAGFGGLRVARGLRGVPADVVVLDQRNFHCFLPLLYQVATAGLEPEEIAQPVRRTLRGSRNARFQMARAGGLDLDRRIVVTDVGEVPYDYLVVAAGSATNYFGIPSLERRTLGLKDLNEATALRNHVLTMFERAAVERHAQRRSALMTLVVVGGGPTGVELAGAFAELKRHVLPLDYPGLDLSEARVILVEATDRLLPSLPPRLRRSAVRQLEALGVEVRLRSAVADVTAEGVTLRDGSLIASRTVVWVAGVRGSTLGEALAPHRHASRRVPVEETLQLPAHAEVYVIGDMAYLEGPGGGPYPMVAPVAIQQGDLVARNLRRQLGGSVSGSLERFVYKDRGTMVTIGRQSAVAYVYGLQVSGFIAWVMWLTVHLVWLIGLRNRLLVLINWVWNYFLYERGVRLITDEAGVEDKGDPGE